MHRRASEQVLSLTELVGLILEQLEDDLKTLMSCSLLAHTWNAICRPFIFHSLTVNVNKEGRSFARLLALLESLAVAHAIRELSLLQSPYTGGHTIDAETVHALLSKLPNLRSLSIRNFHYGNISSTKLLPNLGFKLEQLKLDCRKVAAHPLTTFIEIVSLFSYIGELDVQTIPFREALANTSATRNIPDRMPQIHAVRLKAFAGYNALRFLRDALGLAPGSLRQLGVTFTPDMFPELSAVLGCYGSQLQELRMEFPPTSRPAAKWQELDTESLGSLIKVTVTVLSPSYLAFGIRGPSVADNIAGLLSVLPTTYVREVSFVFAGSGSSRIVLKPSWAAVDTACVRFARLETVSIRRSDDKPPFTDNMQRSLVWAFPEVRRNNWLRIQ